MTFKDRTIIVRRGKRLWYGTIDKEIFTSEGECQDMTFFSDDERKRIVSIYKWAEIQGLDMTKKEIDDIRKRIGYTEIWVMDEESPEPTQSNNISDKTWEKYWFKNYHKMCLSCIKTCKQSSRVDLMCPVYKKK